MNKSDVKIGNYYQFTFLPNWSDFDGAYRITGYASPDVVTAINDGKSLFSVVILLYLLLIFLLKDG